MRYAGIGSRKTPEEILAKMTNLGYHLAKHGFTLLSGGAAGADTAFEQGCDQAAGMKEIFIPWKGFQGRTSGIIDTSPRAMQIARTFHPAWSALTEGAKKLMARNSHQVLGMDLQSPVDFVVCWTPEDHNGVPQGGTSQAIRIAVANGIPVFNLWREGEYERLVEHVKDMLKEVSK